MSKETSSTNRDGSKSVDAFANLSAYKTEDLPQPRIEAPPPPAERRIVLPPSVHVVELYNRNTESDSAVKAKAEESEDDSEANDDAESDEVTAAKKKKAELAAAGKPVRSVRPPRRVLPSFRPDQLKIDTAAELPADVAKATAINELAAEAPHASQGVEEAEMPTSFNREVTPSIDSFGELPAIEEHEWQDVFIPAQRTESPDIHTVNDEPVLTFPEQFAETQPGYDDVQEETELPAATSNTPVYSASSGPSATNPNVNSSNPNTTTTPPVPPAQPGGGGGGSIPPTPPFTASRSTGGNTPPPNNPNNYHMASGSAGFNALPVAAALTGNVVPPTVVLAPRVRVRDTLARVMATAAGAGAYLGYRANKNKIKEVEKANETQYKDLRSQQERLVIDQRIQQMQNENIQHHMKNLRSREAVAATPSRAERGNTEQIVLPPAPVAVRPAAPRSEMKVVTPDKRAEQPEAQGLDNAQEVQPNRRIDHSSWHNYVVENGKVVSDAIEYGQGYRQEQREIIHDRTGDSVVAASATTAAAGATAAAGSAGQTPQHSLAGYSPVYQPSALPSGPTTPPVPPAQPTPVDPQHMLASDNDAKKEPATGPAFWIMLIIIVVAFFAAALI